MGEFDPNHAAVSDRSEIVQILKQITAKENSWFPKVRAFSGVDREFEFLIDNHNFPRFVLSIFHANDIRYGNSQRRIR
jgi:hypothetical protein